MSLLSEFKQIENEADRILLSVAIELRAELIEVTPTGDPSKWAVNIGRSKGDYIKPKGYSGGNLKSSWQPLKKTANGYVLSNTALYADIILEGYRIVNGKAIGSKQLIAGIDPILEKHNNILQEKLKGIK